MKNKTDYPVSKNTLIRKLAPYIFIAPFYFLFLLFGIFPLVYSLFISLHSWNGIREMKFIGFDNYWFILKDDLFWKSLRNTLAMGVLAVVPQHVCALFFAFVLNRGLVKLKEFFKGVMFVPYITASVAVAILFRTMYGERVGLFNYVLETLAGIGMPFPFHLPIRWYKEYFGWFSVSLLTFWRWTGWNTLIYFAGLQSIPDTLYEAGRIDGANWRQVFFYITLPLLRPILYFLITMSIIGTMQQFDDPYILYGSVDAMSGYNFFPMTSAIYMYAYGFQWSKFGVASTSSFYIMFMILILTWINKRIFSDDEDKKKSKKLPI